MTQATLCCPMCRGPLEFERAHNHVSVACGQSAPGDNDDEEEEDCALSIDDLLTLEEHMCTDLQTTMMLI